MKSKVLVAAAGLLAGAVPTLAATTTAPSSTTTVSEVPSQAPTIGVITVHGCYNSAGSMKTNGTLAFCTLGSCGQALCRGNGFLVGATMGQNFCYCGNEYPNRANLVDDSKCNLTCAGDNTEICGGDGFYTVYNTGLSIIVDEADPVVSSSSSASKSSTVSSVAESTPSPTNSSKPSLSNQRKSSTNVAGIAAGTAVGVVVVAGILGVLFFYMRRKRNSEIEEAHRSAAAASHLSVNHKSGGSTVTYDNRLDQDMVQRRMSSGSINDNEDYSRRILRVTNA